MTTSFILPDPESRADLTVYLQRARRVDPEAVRLLGTNGVLAVYAPVLSPRGILDRGPTILGLRTFAEAGGGAFDMVVSPDAVLERLARFTAEHGGPAEIMLPPAEVRVAWSGIAAPRTGYHETPAITVGELRAAARAGINEIADTLPENAGDPIVAGIRMGVWGRLLPGREDLPAGAAFAADALGFLGPDDAVTVPSYRSGGWARLSSDRGHVLIRLGAARP